MERNENDAQILELFEHRSEETISAETLQYGGLCRQIAMNILGNAEDAEECVNDTWLAVWNRIPPEQPRSLTAYICRIAFNEFLAGQCWRPAAWNKAFQQTKRDASPLASFLPCRESRPYLPQLPPPQEWPTLWS